MRDNHANAGSPRKLIVVSKILDARSKPVVSSDRVIKNFDEEALEMFPFKGEYKFVSDLEASTEKRNKELEGIKDRAAQKKMSLILSEQRELGIHGGSQGIDVSNSLILNTGGVPLVEDLITEEMDRKKRHEQDFEFAKKLSEEFKIEEERKMAVREKDHLIMRLITEIKVDITVAEALLVANQWNYADALKQFYQTNTIKCHFNFESQPGRDFVHEFFLNQDAFDMLSILGSRGVAIDYSKEEYSIHKDSYTGTNVTMEQLSQYTFQDIYGQVHMVPVYVQIKKL